MTQVAAKVEAATVEVARLYGLESGGSLESTGLESTPLELTPRIPVSSGMTTSLAQMCIGTSRCRWTLFVNIAVSD